VPGAEIPLKPAGGRAIPFLSVVMPAYNEQGSIRRVVLEHAAVLERLQGAAPEWEIVVVDDASSDETALILENLRERVPRLRVVRHERNQGIYATFSRCYAEARGSHVYSTGSDGQWPAENLALLMDCLLAGADLVIGVRRNRRDVYSVPRRIVSFGFNALPKLLFGVAVQDAGSVKLGLRRAFEFDLVSRSPFFEAERIIRARRSGLKVGFVPIDFLSRSGGKAGGASWRNISSSLRDVLRCVRTYGLR
jgi:dolichol-phosphate mannosyltransferase